MNMKYIGYYVLLHKRVLISRLINKIIQNVDVKEEEKRCINHKFKDKVDLIDILARENIK